MTMQIILIRPGAAPLLRRGLDHLIKGLMLDRANRGALEDREAIKATVDQAVELRRVLGVIEEGQGASLVLGGSVGQFPGLMEIDRACEELFGLDGTPEILMDAIRSLTATLAIGLAASAFVGGRGEAVVDAGRKLLDAFGGDVPHYLRPEALALEEAIDQAEACADPATFTQEAMNDAIERARQWMPGVASWIAAARSLWAPVKEPA